jgi:hypothetical protein
MDKIASPDDDPKDLYHSRSKLDDCFTYIVKTIDEAIPALLPKEGTDLGQVDKAGAAAIKAKVLLWRASPFYSGNTYYFDFYDHDRKPFFPQDDAATTKAKWKDALDAVEVAIQYCTEAGIDLYTYSDRVPNIDVAFSDGNPNFRTFYDLRYTIVEPWNKELIWGYSAVRPAVNNYDRLIFDANIVLPNNYSGVVNDVGGDYNTLGATYKMVERYYTKHGLLIDEDNTFGRDTLLDVTLTPDTAVTNEYLGILQSKVPTVNIYLNREPRFYANMGITGGYWRAHDHAIKTTFFGGGSGGATGVGGSDAYGGASFGGNNRFWTGMGAQKIVHPNNKVLNYRSTFYPAPIIRLADLYLMKAEARNQYLETPDAEVYAAINKVRQRAGIPTVEQAYGGSYVRDAYKNKHQEKEFMKEIILNERGIEFAFEGHRFWDMRRYRRAPQEFSSPVVGWNYNGENAEDFFQLRALQFRLFTEKDCLWPLPISDLTKNSKLIQNPGW